MREKKWFCGEEASPYFVPNPGLVMSFGALEFDAKIWGLWHRSLNATRISPDISFGPFYDHIKCNILFSFANFI